MQGDCKGRNPLRGAEWKQWKVEEVFPPHQVDEWAGKRPPKKTSKKFSSNDDIVQSKDLVRRCPKSEDSKSVEPTCLDYSEKVCWVIPLANVTSDGQRASLPVIRPPLFGFVKRVMLSLYPSHWDSKTNDFCGRGRVGKRLRHLLICIFYSTCFRSRFGEADWDFKLLPSNSKILPKHIRSQAIRKLELCKTSNAVCSLLLFQTV